MDSVIACTSFWDVVEMLAGDVKFAAGVGEECDFVFCGIRMPNVDAKGDLEAVPGQAWVVCDLTCCDWSSVSWLTNAEMVWRSQCRDVADRGMFGSG